MYSRFGFFSLAIYKYLTIIFSFINKMCVFNNIESCGSAV